MPRLIKQLRLRFTELGRRKLNADGEANDLYNLTATSGPKDGVHFRTQFAQSAPQTTS
jgi:hypothetical protein